VSKYDYQPCFQINLAGKFKLNDIVSNIVDKSKEQAETVVTFHDHVTVFRGVARRLEVTLFLHLLPYDQSRRTTTESTPISSKLKAHILSSMRSIYTSGPSHVLRQQCSWMVVFLTCGGLDISAFMPSDTTRKQKLVVLRLNK
jgi:hypothetical protein